MRTTIDAAGRVVIPKALRVRLGLQGGAEVDIAERDGLVEIRPRAQALRAVEDAGGRLVLEAPDGVDVLTDDDVRDIVEETRRWPRD